MVQTQRFRTQQSNGRGGGQSYGEQALWTKPQAKGVKGLAGRSPARPKPEVEAPAWGLELSECTPWVRFTSWGSHAICLVLRKTRPTDIQTDMDGRSSRSEHLVSHCSVGSVSNRITELCRIGTVTATCITQTKCSLNWSGMCWWSSDRWRRKWPWHISTYSFVIFLQLLKKQENP
jgi:hypothetical protein